MTFDAALHEEWADFRFKERDLFRRLRNRGGRRCHHKLRSARRVREGDANGLLHLWPANHAQRCARIRCICFPNRDLPVQTRRVEISIRPQRQPDGNIQPTARASPLDIHLAIEAMNPVCRRAPIRPSFGIENQSPRCLRRMLRPRFAHRAIQLFRCTTHHLRGKVGDEQASALHRDLRHAAGRRQCHVRLPFARFAIEALHLTIALTRHQQIAVKPRHPRRAKQPPAITLRHIQPYLHLPAAPWVKAQHIPHAARHARGNQQSPLRVENDFVRRWQPADDRPHMCPGREVIPLDLARGVHEHQQVRRRHEHRLPGQHQRCGQQDESGK